MSQMLYVKCFIYKPTSRLSLMPANTDNSPKPASNVDTSRPYAEQMDGLITQMRSFMSTKGGQFMTFHDLTGAYPENTKESIVYTRPEVTAAAQRFVRTAAGSSAKYAQYLPTSPSKAGALEALGATYTVTKGDNKGHIRNLVMNACAGVRNAEKREARRVKRSLAIMNAEDNGGAFYATGITDKDGNLVAYGDAASAAKAWARQEPITNDDDERIGGGYGGDWWATDKAARLTEANTHVRQGKAASSTDLQGMSASKARSLAKAAGAPKAVHTGAGAGDRSRNWLMDNSE